MTWLEFYGLLLWQGRNEMIMISSLNILERTCSLYFSPKGWLHNEMGEKNRLGTKQLHKNLRDITLTDHRLNHPFLPYRRLFASIEFPIPRQISFNIVARFPRMDDRKEEDEHFSLSGLSYNWRRSCCSQSCFTWIPEGNLVISYHR